MPSSAAAPRAAAAAAPAAAPSGGRNAAPLSQSRQRRTQSSQFDSNAATTRLSAEALARAQAQFEQHEAARAAEGTAVSAAHEPHDHDAHYVPPSTAAAAAANHGASVAGIEATLAPHQGKLARAPARRATAPLFLGGAGVGGGMTLQQRAAAAAAAAYEEEMASGLQLAGASGGGGGGSDGGSAFEEAGAEEEGDGVVESPAAVHRASASPPLAPSHAASSLSGGVGVGALDDDDGWLDDVDVSTARGIKRIIKNLNEKISKLYQWHIAEIDLVSRQQVQLNSLQTELDSTKSAAGGGTALLGSPTPTHIGRTAGNFGMSPGGALSFEPLPSPPQQAHPHAAVRSSPIHNPSFSPAQGAQPRPQQNQQQQQAGVGSSAAPPAGGGQSVPSSSSPEDWAALLHALAVLEQTDPNCAEVQMLRQLLREEQGQGQVQGQTQSQSQQPQQQQQQQQPIQPMQSQPQPQQAQWTPQQQPQQSQHQFQSQQLQTPQQPHQNQHQHSHQRSYSAAAAPYAEPHMTASPQPHAHHHQHSQQHVHFQPQQSHSAHPYASPAGSPIPPIAASPAPAAAAAGTAGAPAGFWTAGVRDWCAELDEELKAAALALTGLLDLAAAAAPTGDGGAFAEQLREFERIVGATGLLVPFGLPATVAAQLAALPAELLAAIRGAAHRLEATKKALHSFLELLRSQPPHAPLVRELQATIRDSGVTQLPAQTIAQLAETVAQREAQVQMQTQMQSQSQMSQLQSFHTPTQQRPQYEQQQQQFHQQQQHALPQQQQQQQQYPDHPPALMFPAPLHPQPQSQSQPHFHSSPAHAAGAPILRPVAFQPIRPHQHAPSMHQQQQQQQHHSMQQQYHPMQQQHHHQQHQSFQASPAAGSYNLSAGLPPRSASALRASPVGRAEFEPSPRVHHMRSHTVHAHPRRWN